MGKSHGLPRRERLWRTKDFERVFTEGKRRHSRLLGIRFVANGLGHARLGIALSRAWRGAARRNRAKRLVREAFRTHKDALPRGIDLIVLPAPDWDEPSAEAIARELVRLLGDERQGKP